MGFSTFIEINNDFTHEIDEEFLKELKASLRGGENHMGNQVISFLCIHRDDKRIAKLRKLLGGEE